MQRRRLCTPSPRLDCPRDIAETPFSAVRQQTVVVYKKVFQNLHNHSIPIVLFTRTLLEYECTDKYASRVYMYR